MPEQTIEDLGKLVKNKYPAYSSMPDIEVGKRVKAKYPDAYGHFKDVDLPALPGQTNQTSQGPKVAPPGELNPKYKESDEHDFWKKPTLSNFFIPPEFKEDFPRGAAEIANKRYSKGVIDISEGMKRALTPAAIPLAVANPAAALPAVGVSMGAQKGGEYVAKNLGATPDQARAVGEVSSWVPYGSLASKPLREAVSGGVKGAASEVYNAVAKKPLRSLEGYYLGKLVGGPHGEALGGTIALGIPAARGLVRGAREGWLAGKSPESELKVETPGESEKVESKPTETNQPLDRQETLKPEVASTLKEGARRVNPDGSIQVLKRVPLDQIKSDTGNKMYGDVVRSFKTSGYSVQPELREGEGGNYTVHEGHHRVASLEGQKDVLAWTPEKAGTEEKPTRESMQVDNPSEELSRLREQKKLDQPPKSADQPSKLEGQASERAQSENREAKENKLAAFLYRKGYDLNNIKPTSELLKSLGKDAGLSYKPSLRTLEQAIKKAKLLSTSFSQ